MATCGSCGFANPAGLKFCGECGTRLAAQAPVGGRERKVVSVLFCDLVGFTAASDGADPEDVQAQLTPYHARARAEIERFGGTVEKFIGDAVMAVFGAPTAHEDDPERAVRAGLRLLDAVEELNADLGLGLSVRLGVATGEAVVSTGAQPERGEGMVAGDVVNTAARLQTSAPTGALVVGEVTWRATRSVIDYEVLPPVSVKGKADPLPVWRAMRARSRVGEATASTSTPLVGRQDELEMLQRTFARSVRESSVQLVTIVAEPGVGKSRLVQELFEWVDRREELVTWRQGRCLSYGEGITFWALGQVVKAHAGILDTDPTEVVTAKLTEAVGALVSDPSQAGWMVARLGPLVGLAGQESAREELFTAWRGFLEAVAATSPLVVVLEDLHWADEALLEFCEHVLQWVVGVPLLLVATARPELFDKAPNWGAGHRNATTIGLTPLSDAQTAQLITAVLGTAVLPADTHALLLQRAGGNPLYAEEFIRMLADRGQLPTAADPHEVEDDRPELAAAFPESVHAIIAARLDTLPAESKALLHDAAVVGHTFWSGAVAALSGRDEPSVRATLHELSRRDYLRPSRVSSIAGQGEYTFGHALIAEVTYNQIPRAARARKHSAAAQWLQGLIDAPGGHGAGEQAAIIAHHYTTAHTLAVAAAAAAPEQGTDVEVAELADGARHWHRRAAEHARTMDPLASATHYKAALATTPVAHESHPPLLTRLAQVLTAAGRLTEADSMYQQAEAEYRQRGDTLNAAVSAVKRCPTLWLMGRGAEAERFLVEGITTLEQLPPSIELAEGYSLRAGYYTVMGRYADAVRDATEALGIAERLAAPVDVEFRIRALQYGGLARMWVGELDRGEQEVHEALRLAEAHNLTDQEMTLHSNRGWWRGMAISPLHGLPDLERALSLACERGRPDDVLWLGASLAEALMFLGRLDEALEVCDRATRGALDTSTISGEYLDVVRCQVLVVRSRFDEAEALLSRLLPDEKEPGPQAFLVGELVAAVRCAQARDDAGLVRRLADRLASVFSDEVNVESCAYLPEIARILAPTGHRGVVERVMGAALPHAAMLNAGVVTARAVIAETEEEWESAEDLYARAAEHWRSYGYTLEEARCLLGAGRCRAVLGRPSSEPVVAAQRIFEDLGTTPMSDPSLRR